MAGLTIADLEWGNRTPNLFIDTAVKSTKVLSMFTLIDGVKSKIQVPIFSGALSFGTDICVFDPQSTAAIGEKEMSVSTYKWAFQNCKNKLQDTYRSVMLKNGANNAETMDSQFKDWLFDYFSKLAGDKVLTDAANQIRTEILADDDVNKPDQATGDVSKSTILGFMEDAYAQLPATQLAKLFGVADREYKPAFFLSLEDYRSYQLAIAAADKVGYDGTKLGLIETYLGMEVIPFPSLVTNEMILTHPANLVMLVDKYDDIEAIQTTYKPELSSDYLWGQMTYGFSYMVSEDIVYYTAGA